jgi:formylglycine-generating enzyme required for sulfatase activity
MKRIIAVSLCVVALVRAACAITAPIACSISFDGTNTVRIGWYPDPGKSYVIQSTTNLAQSWQNGATLTATNNLLSCPFPVLSGARFFRVVKLDTDPPTVSRLLPSDGAIAVQRQGQLMVWLQDETGIATNSISWAVGTNPPVTLADPRMFFQNGLLTYTPATNQFLGANGQFITSQLVVADTLGHWGTNTWTFKLELVPILAGSVVLISPSSPLTLLSTNGNTYVFSYTNASSGLTNGSILVSTDPNFAYKRLVLSVADNPPGHTVTLVTTQAALADILLQGTVQFFGDSFVTQTGPGPQPKTASTTIQLGSTTPLYNNGQVEIDVPSGQLSFAPDFRIAAEFAGTPSFDLDINATMEFDLTLHASWQNSWPFAASKGIGTPIQQFWLLGWIPTPIPIPVWAEAVWEFNLGIEGQVAAQASVTAGFASSWSLAFGTHLRTGQWTPYANENVIATPYPLSWQGTGSGQVTAYVEPKLTVYLESFAGPTADLKPYLELDVHACVQPGQAGVDAWLYDGLSGTLAVDVRFWNKDWFNLPSWPLFNLQQPIPGAHWSYTTPVGTPMQTIPNMAWIPCGTFVMGSPTSEAERWSDETQHTVTLTQGFYMGKYAVTQGEYLALMGSNPSSTYDYNGNAIPPDLNRPVDAVSWIDATNYCGHLTQQEQAAGRLPAGWVYRLPTESEREYACRAGTTTAFHYGNALHGGMANFYDYYEYDASIGDILVSNPAVPWLPRMTTVGSYQPNAWGLYDMHGNVWEWCRDWYGNYPTGSVTDPQGATLGSSRVTRGGGCYYSGRLCRSACRLSGIPSSGYGDLGFRVILAPGQP